MASESCKFKYVRRGCGESWFFPPSEAPCDWCRREHSLKTTALILFAAAALVACSKETTPPARAEARIALFKQCMELAAKMPRQADDDVSDVVSQCSNQAYYMTNYIN